MHSMISIGLDLGNVVGRFVDSKKYVKEYINTFIKNLGAAQVANLRQQKGKIM